MAKTQHRSLRGKVVDMDMLSKRNELTPAVGNARVNARGDELGAGGKIVKSRDEVVQEYYNSNVADSTGPARKASAPVADVVPDKPKKATKKTTKKPELSAEEEKMFEEFDDEWVEDADGNFVPKK
jgi:hypothetical protein